MYVSFFNTKKIVQYVSCSLLRNLDRVRLAVLNEPNPIPGLTNRFIVRCKKFHNIISCVATPGGDLVKVSSPSNEDAQSDIFRPVDFEDLALVVRQLVDKLVAQNVEKEKRTIDVRVVQEVEQRLPFELARSLQKDHRYQALQRHHHRQQLKKEQLMQRQTARFLALLTWLATGSRSNLSWFGSWFWSGASTGWVFFGYLALFLLLGAALGVNIPQVIYCKEQNGFCYLAKWDKSAVVLPENEKKLLQKYLKLYRPR